MPKQHEMHKQREKPQTDNDWSNNEESLKNRNVNDKLLC
jgi:hypothetical protein